LLNIFNFKFSLKTPIYLDNQGFKLKIKINKYDASVRFIYENGIIPFPKNNYKFMLHNLSLKFQIKIIPIA